MADIGVLPASPANLDWTVSKSPTFQTRIQRAVSGRELRALDYPYPLWQFNLGYEFLPDNQMAGISALRTLMGFYLSCQGAFGTFLYDDPTDDNAAGQPIAAGDGNTAVFQEVRTLGGFVEPITAPNMVTAVYLDGIVADPATYSIDPATGLLTVTAPATAGIAIAADFSYWFRCRFVDDSYGFENFMHNLWSLKKLTFISVRP
jgi:uncharacterized protein (TIGR02217 family)